jgi:hypothetical protein
LDGNSGSLWITLISRTFQAMRYPQTGVWQDAGEHGAADENRRYEANSAQPGERVGADDHEDRLHQHAGNGFERA